VASARLGFRQVERRAVGLGQPANEVDGEGERLHETEPDVLGTLRLDDAGIGDLQDDL
jgi:hypothetical protein